MEKGESAKQADVASIIEILRQLKRAVSKIDPINQMDEAKRSRNTDSFFKKLRYGSIPPELQDEATQLYLAIASKQVEIIEAVKESERKEKKETIDQWILYGIEGFVLFAISLLVFIGLYFEIDAGRLLVCIGAYTIAFCALLFFHAKEYDRVERIVLNGFSRSCNDGDEKLTLRHSFEDKSDSVSR